MSDPVLDVELSWRESFRFRLQARGQCLSTRTNYNRFSDTGIYGCNGYTRRKGSSRSLLLSYIQKSNQKWNYSPSEFPTSLLYIYQDILESISVTESFMVSFPPNPFTSPIFAPST